MNCQKRCPNSSKQPAQPFSHLELPNAAYYLLFITESGNSAASLQLSTKCANHFQFYTQLRVIQHLSKASTAMQRTTRHIA